MEKLTLGKIKQIQFHSEVILGETLASVPAEGLTMEEAFYLYMQAMHWGEEDRFFRLADGSFEEFNPYGKGGWEES